MKVIQRNQKTFNKICSWFKIMSFMKRPAKKFLYFILCSVCFYAVLVTYQFYRFDYRQRAGEKCYGKRECTTIDGNRNEDDYHSYFMDKKCSSNELKHSLIDVVSSKGTIPKPGRSIFFHETSCSSDGFIKLNARQACAIESAALTNPDHDIFVLFASPVAYNNNTKVPIIEALLSYNNINLRNVDLWQYARSTSIDGWFSDGKLFQSDYMNSHVSDFLRYLSLYKFGGIYLDLDVVVMRNFDEIKPNFAGAESSKFVAAGIISFDHEGIGHEIAEMCLREFQLHFDGSDWGNNGPGVITRVLKKICQTESPLEMTSDRCHGFSVFPMDRCYAIGWKNWEYFFEEKYLESTMKILNERSIIAHVWNKFSIKRTIKVGSKVAYAVLAEKYCPKVYSSCGEFF